MATYTVRGNTHNVIYPYRTRDGKKGQQWESYETELEALQRKAYIDILQKKKMYDELLKVAEEYKIKRAAERAAAHPETVDESSGTPIPDQEDNRKKTYREFCEVWLPSRARKKLFSPNTYDSYVSNLQNHILPYFGDRVMSTITAKDIDDFLDYLSRKPCKGHKSYRRQPEDIPTLSSSVIKKCYNILTSGFPTAKSWNYISEIPVTTAPSEKYRKRKAWDSARVFQVMESIDDDPLLRLAVHLAFVCSMRAGEVAGIEIKTIDFQDRSFWIHHQIQRVTDHALQEIPKNEIKYVFPKHVSSSKSSLIMKKPKTEDSIRKQYLTSPLIREIKARIEQIERNKAILGEEYHDHGLLICKPDGTPIDPKSLCKEFKKRQEALKIEPDDQIEFQGLRKSGQMHKVRLTKNNYQLVAENGGQSPEVLMQNYNEALDSEKRSLSRLIEDSFYPRSEQAVAEEAENLLQMLESDPMLKKEILQKLMAVAAQAG